MLNDTEIMCDENVGQTTLALQASIVCQLRIAQVVKIGRRQYVLLVLNPAGFMVALSETVLVATMIVGIQDISPFCDSPAP